MKKSHSAMRGALMETHSGVFPASNQGHPFFGNGFLFEQHLKGQFLKDF